MPPGLAQRFLHPNLGGGHKSNNSKNNNNALDRNRPTLVGSKAYSESHMTSTGPAPRHSANYLLQDITEETSESPNSSNHEQLQKDENTKLLLAKQAAAMDALNGSDGSLTNTVHIRPSLMNKAHSVSVLQQGSSSSSKSLLGGHHSTNRNNLDATTISAPPSTPTQSNNHGSINSGGGSSGLTMKNYRRQLQRYNNSTQQLLENKPDELAIPSLLGDIKPSSTSNRPPRPNLAKHKASSEAILDTLQKARSQRALNLKNNRDASKRLDGHSSLSLLAFERTASIRNFDNPNGNTGGWRRRRRHECESIVDVPYVAQT